MGINEFTGDVEMLSPRAAIIRAVASEDSQLIELSGAELQGVIADHIDISDIIISASVWFISF